MARKKKSSTNRVGIIVDETGSMWPERERTIEAVNAFFRALGADVRVTLATFNSATGVAFRCGDTPAQDVPPLTSQNYRPAAVTPLFDALGKMIEYMRGVAQPGDKVVIQVVTDGLENASQEYDLDAVKALLAQQAADGWAFAYIGAGPEAWGGGSQVNLAADAQLNVQSRQVKSALRASSHAAAAFFAGRTSNDSYYSQSRHLVSEDE